MKFLPICFLLICAQLGADEASRTEYLTLITSNPEVIAPIGNASKGEIEILIDPEKMAEIEGTTGRDVGVIKRDDHWIWLNDACLFPDGSNGVVGRVLANNLLSRPGAGVLPVLPDGKVVLNCEFRHATRCWELEMPRGGVKPGETIEAAATRELLEETGFVVNELVPLGEAAGDSGVTGMIVPVFMARIIDKQKPHRESSEAIYQTVEMTVCEIREAFLKGYIECPIKGERRRVFARDPFLAYALTVVAAMQTHR